MQNRQKSAGHLEAHGRGTLAKKGSRVVGHNHQGPTPDEDDGQTTEGRVVAAPEISMEVRGGEEAGKKRTGKRVLQVHVEIAGPMPIMLDGEREHVYIIVDDHSRRVYTRLLHLKLVVEVFKAFRVAAENESEKGIQEIMMDNTNY